MVYFELLESSLFPDHYHIPGVETAVISTSGVVIELISMYCPLVSYNSENKDAYPLVYLPGYGTPGIHRLLTTTFIACPGEFKDYQVNHIDGDKSNYKLNNLEWTNYSGNVKHALVTGLRQDNHPILVKNLMTNEVSNFYSLNSTARFFGCNPEKLSRYLKGKMIAPFAKHFLCVYLGDEWPDLNAEDVGKVTGGPKPLLVIDRRSGKASVYESAIHAARELGVSGSLMYYYLTNGNVWKERELEVYLPHQCPDVLDDAEYVVDQFQAKPIVTPKRTPVPILVTDTTTGITEWWEGTRAFANSMGVKWHSLRKSVSLKRRWKHFLIEYQEVKVEVVSDHRVIDGSNSL